jgi:hypothetical protein
MDFYRRNELPETVKRYKQYTDNFQEWLMKMAVQRGVEQAAQIAEQAKKKKGKKTYKMSTEQQQILVDGIAESKEPLKIALGSETLMTPYGRGKRSRCFTSSQAPWTLATPSST